MSDLSAGSWTAFSGAATGGVTAVFAANDQMALGALRTFHEAGLHVPDDISVIGFDDQPGAAYFIPPLTTVSQEFTELGVRCLQMLLFDMTTGNSGATTIVSPKLVIRASTRAAYRRDRESNG